MIECNQSVSVYKQERDSIDGIEISSNSSWTLVGRFNKVLFQTETVTLKADESREYPNTVYTLVFDSKDQTEIEPYRVKPTQYVKYEVDSITYVGKIVYIKKRQIFKGCCRYRFYVENLAGRECEHILNCISEVIGT